MLGRQLGLLLRSWQSHRGVQPTAHRPHAAQDSYEFGPTQNHKFTANLFFCSSAFVSVCVFNAWPKTTLLPVWPRDAKRMDTFGRGRMESKVKEPILNRECWHRVIRSTGNQDCFWQEITFEGGLRKGQMEKREEKKKSLKLQIHKWLLSGLWEYSEEVTLALPIPSYFFKQHFHFFDLFHC